MQANFDKLIAQKFDLYFMENYLGVLGSDQINRDGYKIMFSALARSIAENALQGMPSLIDHDFHRPLGWIFPFGILIEPGITKTIGNFFMCENSEDTSAIYPKIQNYWWSYNKKACEDYIDEFKNILKDNFDESGKFIEKGCVAYVSKNIAEKTYHDLFEKKDKDGLLYLDDILRSFEYIGSGIFRSKADQLCIFCHQYFKRNLSLANNYNTYFIDELISLNTNINIKLRIAIDKNIIGLSKTYKGILEFDYWFGPKFSNEISNIPNGVTRYESDEYHKLFNGISETEFWWKSDDNEKILEIEEVRETPSLGIDAHSFGCRYIHSIYDSGKQQIVHFDGAIRLYSEESILERWDTSINKAGKNTRYTKLFRIDGKLELADWKKLCILYYKGNPLLFEYFGMKDEYENILNVDESQNPLDKYLPYRTSKEEGLRLFVSYHEKQEEYYSFDRKIINPDIINFDNNDAIKVLEYDIIEIEKYLKRIDQSILYPNEINFIKTFDFYTNYPLIIHGYKTQSIKQSIKLTLEAYKAIFKIQSTKIDKTICLSIGWEMVDFEVRLSIFGKSTEILKWLELNQNIPTDNVSFSAWLIQQKDWIYNNYVYSQKTFTDLLKIDGIFYIKRKAIKQNQVTFTDEDDSGNFKVDIIIDEEAKNLLEKQVIYPSRLGLIREAYCTKTGENYFTSTTSKYLDSDVKMAIKKIDLLGFFWTDEMYK